MKIAAVIISTLMVGAVTTSMACSTCGCSAMKAEKACSCGACAGCTGEELNTQQMESVVAKKSATVVDARGARAESEHIPGAKLLTTDSTAEEIAKVLPNKEAPVVTYCGSTSCSASPKLAKKLKELGYTNVREYPEGIKGWKEAEKKTASK